MYEKVLQQFDGSDMTSYLDFFFVPSPLNRRIWTFVDDDARLDFRDSALEMGLIPSLNEVMEGEDKDRKIERDRKEKIMMDNERAKNIQRSKNEKKQKNVDSKKGKIGKRLNTSQITIDRLMNRLKIETDPIVRENIQNKIERTLKIIETSM
jgi:hypothetical protein